MGKACPFPFGPAPAPGPGLRLLLLLPVLLLLYGGLFGGGPPTGLRLKLLSSRRPPTSRSRSSRCLFQWYGWGRFLMLPLPPAPSLGPCRGPGELTPSSWRAYRLASSCFSLMILSMSSSGRVGPLRWPDRDRSGRRLGGDDPRYGDLSRRGGLGGRGSRRFLAPAPPPPPA